MKSNDNVKKSKMGRPTVDTAPVTLRFAQETLEALEEFRRKQEVIPSRTEAIRLLVVESLKEKGYLPK